ncbi:MULTISPECIES: bifunctional 4-hydroxy-2-oxoglutarate aldolase/2-dehydro-3-deoxy-phosphogluconate aldolase [unclassified Streptomyces]|uniref:bifunctional 4-hydroxy-2-oxoglutarate aldolase/2-dehydro-3-deoxy-phosphogluconate aldolase n=1 Tax=unclassified Streptomyces TaxID=2593676 RepID=UPI000F4D5BFD|nr:MULTISPECIES: bifunctional 4-hydroxy-2-oxoglutarate aldolase/2-dehydro-3-deoxy-phosphogluconate aldolase [unclassified Streptomyces]MDH6493852.1 2-dehydro-3-deoxyphosphogluconate aldolase/(4S)-4-hydroxy-2-oxoglutarate aldolase [Streptomyces sp. SAI-149]QUC58940.1 bifunctional 4-hydroxy-2-oxoglutarate aldolase/2-dehydro-3-deoxy-phosphogluconate aldolase [Streptomyces sp. A2-16]
MDLRAALADRRLVAIVRGGDPDAALRTVLALAEEGIDLIEVSLSSVDALAVIARSAAELGPHRPIGAGTVLTADDARAAQDAGAAFAVTPGLGAGADTARELGLPVLAGVMTPTEVITAQAQGADALKLFPAAHAGGPAYLTALRAPFPDAAFVPVGGVDLEAARAYLTAGATAVGVGSPLVADAADGGSLSALRRRARAFRNAVEEATA